MLLISLPTFPHIPAFSALVDSGLSHCFIDSHFVTKHNIPTYSVSPLQLHLFDGTSNSVIMQGVDLPIHFLTGEIISVALFATPLDSTCFLVLGHNWLTCYNLSIDWALGSINFHSTLQEMPSTPLTSVPSGAKTLLGENNLPLLTTLCHSTDTTPLSIVLVDAAAYIHACKMEGSVQFSMLHIPESVDLCSTSTAEEQPDLSHVPPEYHDFANVFNKAKADRLLPHCPYDLKIDLEDGATPPLSTMYSLSPTELEALQKFLDENLANGIICPSSSTHETPVIFVKKKDGSLCLCVDF